MSNIASLMRPRSVAIVGDTPGPGRGAAIHDGLLRYGFTGPIYPVNPKYQEIKGLKAYPSLLDIPDPVEFVAVALGQAHALRVMQEAVRKQVKAMLYIASGFSETGDEGREAQAQLRQLAQEHGIAVCGPNCYGVANIQGKFVAYSGPLATPMQTGPVALVFQSGALTHSVTDPVISRGTGYSFIVTTGNEAVTELADYIEYIADDPVTRVIACFVEGFKDPQHFIAAARKAIANGKRMVVLKVGRSELAQKATMAHTGSLAGEDRALDALLRQLGVIRVHDLDELIETAELLTHISDIGPGTPAILSISGGSCGIMADLAQDLGLQLRSPGPESTARLREVLPAFATVNNPLDLTGAVGEDPSILPRSLAILAADPAVSLVSYAINTPIASDPGGQGMYLNMARAMVDSYRASGKPHVVFSMSSGRYEEAIARMCREAGVPALQGMRPALAAITRLQRATGAIQQLADPAELAGPPPAGLQALVRGSVTTALTERESKSVLALAGVPVTAERLAQSAEEAVSLAADMGYPVVMKIDSPDIMHKTDAGCVRLGVADATAVAAAYAEILANARRYDAQARIGGVLVQEMVRGGVETLIGVTSHAGLGPAVVFGLGGIFVEALQDVSMRMAPLTAADAAEMVREIRAARVLRGFRGQPPVDLAALERTLVQVGKLAWWLRADLKELDINPMLALPEGKGVKALDALLVRC